MFKKIVLIIVAILLLACGIVFLSDSNDYLFSDDFENTSEFLIKPQGEFSFNLASNPSTGYVWNYTIEYGNPTFLDKTFVQDDAYVEAVGIGGADYFSFKFDQIGLAKIKFDYSRPWEDSSLCTKEYVILVY